MNGTITRKMEDKGFGFIRAQEKDYFFHSSQCVTDFNALNIGDEVTFETEKSPKGPRATSITRV